MPYTEEELLNKMGELPEDLKDAIFSAGTSEILAEIGKKYALHVDKVGELVNETGLVMVGITHPKDFIPHLTERLETDQSTARKIAEEINQQIFQKVRESLKKIHGMGEPELTAQKPESGERARPETKLPEVKIETAPPLPPKPELKPLEIRPGPTAPPPGHSAPSPTTPLPKMPEPKPAPPVPPPPPPAPPPSGLAFEEKTKESVFRTPAETREKVEEKPDGNLQGKSFAELKKEIKEAGPDPYREPVE